MENISDRIIKIVEALGVSKSEFARKINVSPSYISKLDKEPERMPSERMIIDICRTFNVSYKWLTTGQGEMFLEPSDATIDALISAYNLDEVDKEILSAYIQMDKQEREALKSFIKTLIKK